jgi:hypothetical protein
MRMFCSASEYAAKAPVTNADNGRANERMLMETDENNTRRTLTARKLHNFSNGRTVGCVYKAHGNCQRCHSGDGEIQVPVHFRPIRGGCQARACIDAILRDSQRLEIHNFHGRTSSSRSTRQTSWFLMASINTLVLFALYDGTLLAGWERHGKHRPVRRA